MKTRNDTCIATYNSKQEAEEALHDMAMTLCRLKGQNDFGVHVRCVQGVWGVWLKERA